MKLATLRDGRDGRLVLVSRDLSRCISAVGIAPTLQAALDDWATARPALDTLAKDLEFDDRGEPFDESACSSPQVLFGHARH